MHHDVLNKYALQCLWWHDPFLVFVTSRMLQILTLIFNLVAHPTFVIPNFAPTPALAPKQSPQIYFHSHCHVGLACQCLSIPPSYPCCVLSAPLRATREREPREPRAGACSSQRRAGGAAHRRPWPEPLLRNEAQHTLRFGRVGEERGIHVATKKVYGPARGLVGGFWCANKFRVCSRGHTGVSMEASWKFHTH